MSAERKYLQGLFVPMNPKKYLGNVKNIVFRSSWELRMMRFFDTNPGIIWWNSEELRIPYRSPLDGRVHRYHPDFIVNVRTKQGAKVFMIEIKPSAQTELRPAPQVQTRKYLTEVATYAVNTAKWQAAMEFCEQHDWEFKVITEKDVPAFTLGKRT